MNTFKTKLHKLPKEVQDYLVSMKAANLNVLICHNNNIKGEDISKITKLISQIFFKEIELKDMVVKISELFNFSEKKSKKVAADIAGIRLFVIENWLSENIKNYIKSLGENSDDYAKYISEQEKAIKEEEEYFKKELAIEKPFEMKIKKQVPVKPRPLDKEKEKKNNLEIFSSSVKYFLQAQYDEYLNTYNKLLILLLFEDNNFKKELEKTLYNNAELLTHAHFDVEGKPISPTIGNWVQDFIRAYGTAYANNLAITKYITESKNAERLNPDDKKLLQKLLQLYRNLKFFPDAFSDLPPERWEIIPSSEDKSDSIKPEKKLTFPKTKAEKEIDSLVHEEEKYKEGGLERLAIEEEVDKKKKVEELEIELRRYKDGSLEKQAILEELNVLKR